MAISVDSSPMSIKELYFLPFLKKSGSYKLKQQTVSQDKRRLSQLALQPVNSTKYHVVGPLCGRSVANPSTSFRSSAASLLVRPRHLSYWSSAPQIALSSPAFLNSLTLNPVSKMRKRTEKGRDENPGLCRGSVVTKEETIITQDGTEEENVRSEGGGGNGDGNGEGGGGGGGGGGGDAVGWISSALIFAFWAGLLFYAFTTAPNQTQVISQFDELETK